MSFPALPPTRWIFIIGLASALVVFGSQRNEASGLGFVAESEGLHIPRAMHSGEINRAEEKDGGFLIANSLHGVRIEFRQHSSLEGGSGLLSDAVFGLDHRLSGILPVPESFEIRYLRGSTRGSAKGLENAKGASVAEILNFKEYSGRDGLMQLRAGWVIVPDEWCKFIRNRVSDLVRVQDRGLYLKHDPFGDCIRGHGRLGGVTGKAQGEDQRDKPGDTESNLYPIQPDGFLGGLSHLPLFAQIGFIVALGVATFQLIPIGFDRLFPLQPYSAFNPDRKRRRWGSGLLLSLIGWGSLGLLLGLILSV